MSDAKRVVTVEEHVALMHLAFNHVCDKQDWKAEIDCLVPWECANVYMQAIEFMTATKPTAEAVWINFQQMYRLRSPGYRAGPAGG